MTVCGIVAEYNPFHAGHAHHIAETRRILGADRAVVCAMSGNFVQRGDLAVMEKYARAEAAVRCGADLVLETPLAACLSSAEGFARGAVSLLDALGCVTHLSFGAEQADLALLQQAADLSRGQSETLRQGLAAGLPYAA
ncbi:MAG: nucleotidyltransferase family protein, partial [Agathobaculum sp.]